MLALAVGCDGVEDHSDTPYAALALVWSSPHERFLDGANLNPLAAGDLVVSGADRRVAAYDAVTGRSAWARPWPADVYTAESEWTTADNRAFVAALDSRAAQAIDLATGQTVWNTQLPSGFEYGLFSNAAAGDGSVYFPVTRSDNARLVARLDAATGQWIAAFRTRGTARGLALAGGHLVAATTWQGQNGSQAGNVVGLDPTTGVEVWSYDPGPDAGGFSTAPLWSDGQRVWAATALGEGGVLVCLEATTGAVVWERRGLPAFASTLAQTPAGLRYITNDGLALNVHDAETGRLVWSHEWSGYSENEVAYAGGVVYHAHGRVLYAFDAATGAVLAQTEAEDGSAFWSIRADAAHGLLYVITDSGLEARHLVRGGSGTGATPATTAGT